MFHPRKIPLNASVKRAADRGATHCLAGDSTARVTRLLLPSGGYVGVLGNNVVRIPFSKGYAGGSKLASAAISTDVHDDPVSFLLYEVAKGGEHDSSASTSTEAASAAPSDSAAPPPRRSVYEVWHLATGMRLRMQPDGRCSVGGGPARGPCLQLAEVADGGVAPSTDPKSEVSSAVKIGRSFVGAFVVEGGRSVTVAGEVATIAVALEAVEATPVTLEATTPEAAAVGPGTPTDATTSDNTGGPGGKENEEVSDSDTSVVALDCAAPTMAASPTAEGMNVAAVTPAAGSDPATGDEKKLTAAKEAVLAAKAVRISKLLRRAEARAARVSVKEEVSALKGHPRRVAVGQSSRHGGVAWTSGGGPNGQSAWRGGWVMRSGSNFGRRWQRKMVGCGGELHRRERRMAIICDVCGRYVPAWDQAKAEMASSQAEEAKDARRGIVGCKGGCDYDVCDDCFAKGGTEVAQCGPPPSDSAGKADQFVKQADTADRQASKDTGKAEKLAADVQALRKMVESRAIKSGQVAPAVPVSAAASADVAADTAKPETGVVELGHGVRVVMPRGWSLEVEKTMGSSGPGYVVRLL